MFGLWGRKTKLPKREGRIFVHWDPANEEVVSLLGNRVVISSEEPIMVYPAETGYIHPAWFASNNPSGIPILNARHPGWSIVVARRVATGKDSDMIVILRDCNGDFEVVNRGFVHHAIYYHNWQVFKTDLRYFENEWSMIINRPISDHSWATSNKGDSAGETERKIKFRTSSVYHKKFCDVYRECRNFQEWIIQSSPHKTRLFWARNRLNKIKQLCDEFYGDEKVKALYDECGRGLPPRKVDVKLM